MRDYLSPARAYIGKTRAQIASLSKFTLKTRVMTMFASTAIVAFFAASVVSLKFMSNDSSKNNIVTTPETKVVPGNSSVTQIGNPQPPVDNGNSTQSSSTQSTSASSSESRTAVTVNNQPVTVPQSGTVSKTITSNGNTTHVDITVNSSTTVNGSSTFQMNTNTVSQNVSTHLP